ncbi:unnamed protein product [Oikopleura dioica]|uniref:Uncharacterized protein n=1 Tax=Oikopleura dioica TaxID=34765 RepID=E4XET0_OIKDI|nr:unnamed protein product [Oikopleura dioica]
MVLETGDSIDITGLVIILIFYFAVAGVGVWAGWKNRHKGKGDNGYIVGDRDISTTVGVFTMTATWVCGGYINGSAEIVFQKGLLWCQAAVGYTLSMAIGGIFFAKQIRATGATTMIDPLKQAYGRLPAALLVIPAVIGDLLWSTAVLAALGTTLSVILNTSETATIIISAAVGTIYTVSGGIYAVAYTDIMQLVFIAIGLFTAMPFVLTSEPVAGNWENRTADWLGTIPEPKMASWIDSIIMLMLGGIPWQGYFQRVLSASSDNSAKILSFCGAIGTTILVIPPVVIGASAKIADWSLTSLDGWLLTNKRAILPLSLEEFTPTVVGYFGLGSVAAAVMSSIDSSMLSGASMLTANIIQEIAEVKGYRITNKVGGYLLKMNIILLSVIATYLSLTFESIYELFHFAGDLVYVLLFPQLTSSLYLKDHVNGFGSVTAFVFGTFVRLLSGEHFLGIPALIKWPGYDESVDYKHPQLFPFKTTIMLLVFAVLLISSKIKSKYLTKNNTTKVVIDEDKPLDPTEKSSSSL